MRRFWVLVLVLVVLGAGAVVADTLTRHQAERTVAQKVTAAAPGILGVKARVHGVPFLTQLAGGKLTHVTATAAAYAAGAVQLDHVRADLYGLTANPAVADRVEVAARVTPQALTDALDGRVTIGISGDQLTATVPGTALTAVVRPTVVAQGLRLDTTALSLVGVQIATTDLPLGLGDALQGLVVAVDLPMGLQLDSVEIRDDVVHVAISGRDVDLDAIG